MTTTELELIQIDPANLTVRDQAREDATPDDELVASVKAHGIMQPPVVEITGDGDYVIVIGHRRVGAAIVAGINPITVIARHSALADEALTLEQQIVENERRRALSPKDLAVGYEKLTLFGLTPADIAAQLGEKPEKIRAGLKINQSAAAAQLVADEPAIDFEQAAIIAEFDEHPKLQKKLIETATTNPANFQRDVENSRTQREVDSRVDKLKAQLDERNVTLADVLTYGAEWWPGKGRTLDRIGIATEDHVDCPGHAAIIHKAQSYYLNEQPESWLRYVCTDWEANGHTPATPATREKTAEELEAEAQWEREKAERAARQQLIEANTRARRAWLHSYLTTGRLRPTATHFDIIAEALAAQIETAEPAPHIALELLTGEPVTRRYYYQPDSNEKALAAVIDDPATPNLRIIVANAIATFEDAIEFPRAVVYFDALAGWGYTLTDTDREHIAAAEAELADEAGEEVGGADYSDYETDDEDVVDE